ncbi:hypothetical protein A2U01_0067068, partial [Trifolium medium]|nr:hypothetical protein [Trifolium medium]
MLEGWGYNVVDMHVDSSVVVNVIQIGYSRSLTEHALVKAIRRLLDLNWDVTVAHSYRESNR